MRRTFQDALLRLIYASAGRFALVALRAAVVAAHGSVAAGGRLVTPAAAAGHDALVGSAALCIVAAAAFR